LNEWARENYKIEKGRNRYTAKFEVLKAVLMKKQTSDTTSYRWVNLGACGAYLQRLSTKRTVLFQP
jgi:hypothetical protein